MTKDIRNLQIDGVDVPFYDGYVTVQEGVVTGKLTWNLYVVDYAISALSDGKYQDINPLIKMHYIAYF
ncbi:hypothetical protein ACQVPW_25945 [Bacillus cereus]|uniref:hypothetical protein n=1 Tax=Bacillus cereus TaxID=1396 RepID=UPI003D662928